MTNSQRSQVEKIKKDVQQFIENNKVKGFDFEVKEFEVTKNCWDQVYLKITLIDENKKSEDKNAKIRIGKKGKIQNFCEIAINGKCYYEDYICLNNAFVGYLMRG